MPPSLRRQFALQLGALLLVLSLAWPLHLFTATAVDWQVVALSTGALAFLIAVLSRQAWWWRCIHLGFAPLAWSISQLGIAPGWFLLAFAGSLLIYRGALTGQIPLFFSNGDAVEALSTLIEARDARCFVDLGAGVGSVVVPLAARFPGVRFVGVENSPLPWLVGWLRTRGRPNCQWRWGDLWQADLRQADIIYAFLSPAPMQRLGRRIAEEMAPQAIFVSNSFPLPEQATDLEIAAGDRMLFAYLAPGLKTATA